VSALSFAPFDRPFTLPFIFGNQSVSQRRGFVLKREAAGRLFFSEASPLPGHSSDTVEDVKHALETGRLEGASVPPSLRFALEGLTAQETCRGFRPVRANALIPWGETSQLAAAVAKAAEAGYAVCKLKLPRSGWEAALPVLAAFPQLRFRLDANRGLGPDEFARLLDTLEKGGFSRLIDYIEEPFTGVWDNRAFARAPVPLAADESAPDLRSARLLLEAPNPPACFVVKPTVFGGLASLDEGLQDLRAAGKRVILTSSLETEPGRRALIAYLATRESEVAGIATGFLFRESFVPDQPVFEKLPAFSKAEVAYLRALRWSVSP